MAVHVDGRETFHGRRLCYERVLSLAHSRPQMYNVYTTKAEHVAPRAYDRFCLFSLSLVPREPPSFLPTFAMEYILILFGHGHSLNARGHWLGLGTTSSAARSRSILRRARLDPVQSLQGFVPLPLLFCAPAH